jgi:hypothetical protein
VRVSETVVALACLAVGRRFAAGRRLVLVSGASRLSVVFNEAQNP